MPEDPPPPSALEIADALVSAATHETLPERPVSEWLRSLRKLQDTDGTALHGTFRARPGEETLGADPTLPAAIGLRLLIVRIGFIKSLEPEDTALIDEILADLETRLRRSLVHTHRESPSRILGDLACAWLIAALQHRGDIFHLEKALSEAVEYCETRHWGNGEHLGDHTAARCLDALSVPLILGSEFPEGLRTRCLSLLNALLAIDDAYGPLPRVPHLCDRPGAIERTISYRSRILDPNSGEALPGFLRRSGWESIVDSPTPQSASFETRCYGNAMARAHFETDVRLGSLDRFPLMPSSERRDSGLSWHSHPVVFRRTDGDIGFFQWETREGDTTARHPDAAPCALTSSVDPPIVGRTYAIQDGPDAIVLRILPAIARSWDHVVDRFRLQDCHAEATAAEEHTARWCLRLQYPDRTIAVSRFDLPGAPFPTLTEKRGNEWQWDLRYDREALTGRRILVHLWAISLVRGSAWPPAIVPCPDSEIPRTPDETAYDFRWKSAARNWHLLIDPLSASPLTEL